MTPFRAENESGQVDTVPYIHRFLMEQGLEYVVDNSCYFKFWVLTGVNARL